jgi:flagellar biosynthetic protein FliS
MYATTARDRFSAGNLEGVSGPRIVTMCFDRLDRDLAGALRAIEQSDHYETNAALSHAQDLISEMAGMLDTTQWQHAGALLAIYDYLLRLLAVANAQKNASLVREAAHHIAEIGAAFRQAAVEPTTTGRSLDHDGVRPSFSIQA